MADVLVNVLAGASYGVGDIIYVWDDAEIAQQWANLKNGNHPLLPYLEAAYPAKDRYPLVTQAIAVQATIDGVILPGSHAPRASEELRRCCVLRVGNLPVNGKSRFMAPQLETATVDATGVYTFRDGKTVIWRATIQQLTTKDVQVVLSPPNPFAVPVGWQLLDGPRATLDGGELRVDPLGRPQRVVRTRRAFFDVTARLSPSTVASLQDPQQEVDLRRELPPVDVTTLSER